MEPLIAKTTDRRTPDKPWADEHSVAAVRTGVSQSKEPKVAAREIHQALHQADAELILFFCSPDYELAALGEEIRRVFGGRNIIGCTTAGEITPLGYLQGSVRELAYRHRHFGLSPAASTGYSILSLRPRSS